MEILCANSPNRALFIFVKGCAFSALKYLFFSLEFIFLVHALALIKNQGEVL